MFSYNHCNLFSIRDGDHLRMHGSIRDRVTALVREHGGGADIARVELLTVPRFLRCPFSPVSYYYAYRSDGSLACVVAEVNNTFHERHLYVLNKRLGEAGDLPPRFDCPNEFHVWPFDAVDGTLEFSLSALGLETNLQMSLVREGRPVVVTEIGGRSFPLTAQNLIRALGRRPLGPWLIRLEIALAELWLRRIRRVPVRPKPPAAR